MTLPRNDEVVVLDDALSPKQQDFIESALLSDDFPWFYNRGYVRHGLDESVGVYGNRKIQSGLTSFNGNQFNHIFFLNGEIRSNLYATIATTLLHALPVAVEQILRVKANLVVPSIDAKPNSVGIPHVDDKSKLDSFVALYYVNDSDGDTVIFNETPDSQRFSLTEKKLVSPKKGRMVIFPGNYIHGSGVPKVSETRCVININFVPWSGAIAQG
jgi:hypothetical protein